MVIRIWNWLTVKLTAGFEYIKKNNNSNNDPFSDNPCIIL